jgi:alkylation response protein AidB-like acyl-CoA dehydrogenase
MSASLVPAEHERDLAAALREAFADQLSSAALRVAVESTEGFPPGLWKTVAQEIGLCGLTIPEQFGGLGLGMLEANTVHTELGRVLFPGPFLPCALAATALQAAGDRAACERWLPPIAAGELIATVVGGDAIEVTTRATGSASFVLAGHVADLFLILRPDGLFAVESSPEVSVDQMTGLDLTRRLTTVRFADAAARPVGAAAGASVAAHLRLALAAEAVGGLEWCLKTCVEYAKTREQFGRVIGSFQAVAHACVQLLSDVQTAGAATRWAAHAAATGSAEAELAGHVAALRAGEAYRTQTEAAIHLLGGVGFTWEHDAHLYYRRARSASALGGGAAFHRAAIADEVGLTP